MWTIIFDSGMQANLTREEVERLRAGRTPMVGRHMGRVVWSFEGDDGFEIVLPFGEV